MANDEKVRGSNGRSGGNAPVDTLHSVPPTGESASEEAASVATTTDASVPAILDLTPELLGELARAMQNAVDHERERIAALVNQGGTAHVERVRARAASEAEELRRLAEEDVDRIKEWSTTEIARIREEVSRRTGARRSSLEQYLTHHDAVTKREIESIENAIRDYGETLKRFFSELTRSSDPEEIARRAGSLPPMPDLDAIGSAARAAAVSASDDVEAGTVPGPWTESIPAPTGSVPGGQIEASGGDTSTDTGLVGVMDASNEPAAEASTEPDATVGDTVMLAVDTSVTPVTTVPESSMDAAAASGTETDGNAESGESPAEPPAPSEPHGAAVRLLRSIAPWTAPTNDQNGDDQPD
jgi:hypothetical protein